MYTFVESKEEHEFILFLVTNKIYTVFMRNLSYDHLYIILNSSHKNWNEYKKEYDPKDWLLKAFPFSHSQVDYPEKASSFEKHIFWYDLHEKWKRYAIEMENNYV